MDFPIPRVVISKCIEFDSCRWDGAMIHSKIIQKLKPLVEFIPICPEVEIGLGVPRKPIRLIKNNSGIRLCQSESGQDFTEKMMEFSRQFLSSLKNIDGFILKDRSPSCGNKDVRFYPSAGKVAALKGKESGLFGKAVVGSFSHLAIENEGRLSNFLLREHFFTRLFTITRFHKILKEPSIKKLIDFQSFNKLLFMSYNQKLMRQMGKIIANHEHKNLKEILNMYSPLLYKMFAKAPKYTSNINVLMHALGYFSKKINSDEKAYFLDLLEDYRNNVIPLSSCSSVLSSWAIRFQEKYLLNQSFFHPYPNSLVEITDSGKGRG